MEEPCFYMALYLRMCSIAGGQCTTINPITGLQFEGSLGYINIIYMHMHTISI